MPSLSCVAMVQDRGLPAVASNQPPWAHHTKPLAASRLGRRPQAAPSASQDTAPDLVELDRFEQSAKVSFAESLVSLALNNLEKDRTDNGRGKNLQQHFVLSRRTIDQDAPALERRRVLAMSRQACGERFVICVGCVLECHSALAQRGHRAVDVTGAERDVLDPFSLVGNEILLDLALVVRALVDGNADLAARTRHRLALEPGEPALDVEVAHLAEVE